MKLSTLLQYFVLAISAMVLSGCARETDIKREGSVWKLLLTDDNTLVAAGGYGVLSGTIRHDSDYGFVYLLGSDFRSHDLGIDVADYATSSRGGGWASRRIVTPATHENGYDGEWDASIYRVKPNFTLGNHVDFHSANLDSVYDLVESESGDLLGLYYQIEVRTYGTGSQTLTDYSHGPTSLVHISEADNGALSNTMYVLNDGVPVAVNLCKGNAGTWIIGVSLYEGYDASLFDGKPYFARVNAVDGVTDQYVFNDEPFVGFVSGFVDYDGTPVLVALNGQTNTESHQSLVRFLPESGTLGATTALQTTDVVTRVKPKWGGGYVALALIYGVNIYGVNSYPYSFNYSLQAFAADGSLLWKRDLPQATAHDVVEQNPLQSRSVSTALNLYDMQQIADDVWVLGGDLSTTTTDYSHRTKNEQQSMCLINLDASGSQVYTYGTSLTRQHVSRTFFDGHIVTSASKSIPTP